LLQYWSRQVPQSAGPSSIVLYSWMKAGATSLFSFLSEAESPRQAASRALWQAFVASVEVADGELGKLVVELQDLRSPPSRVCRNCAKVAMALRRFRNTKDLASELRIIDYCENKAEFASLGEIAQFETVPALETTSRRISAPVTIRDHATEDQALDSVPTLVSFVDSTRAVQALARIVSAPRQEEELSPRAVADEQGSEARQLHQSSDDTIRQEEGSEHP
jgi:hypothetical protein